MSTDQLPLNGAESLVHTLAQIELYLRQAADRVAIRLRARGYRAGGVRVKLKTSGFALVSRQATLSPPSDISEVLFTHGRQLVKGLLAQAPFRLVGLAVFDLAPADESRQLDLFAAPVRQRVLESTLDAVGNRFGRHVIRRAQDLGRPGTVMTTAPTLDFRQRADRNDVVDVPPGRLEADAWQDADDGDEPADWQID